MARAYLRFLSALAGHELPNRRQMGRRHRGGDTAELFASRPRRKGPDRKAPRRHRRLVLIVESAEYVVYRLEI